jgi:uncharacterized PurR-regulated membrane protein YhhQ (DUF165 family)
MPSTRGALMHEMYKPENAHVVVMVGMMVMLTLIRIESMGPYIVLDSFMASVNHRQPHAGKWLR